MKIIWNGLWTDNYKYNFKIIKLLISLEVFLAFSPFGYIVVEPVSVTTLHLMVLVAALWGGPIGGGLVGIVFGITSLWKAEVTAVNPADLIYAPSKSGNFWGSMMLSVGSRMLYGMIAGFVFMILFRYVKKYRLPVFCVAAVLLERVHPMCIYYCMEHIFHVEGITVLRAWTRLFTIEKLIQAMVIIFLIIGAYYFYSKILATSYYEECKMIAQLGKTRRFFSVTCVTIFISCIILILVHMVERMDIIWNIAGMNLDEDIRFRVTNVLLQFVLALVATSNIFIELARHRNSLITVIQRNHDQEYQKKEVEMQKKANEAKTIFLSSMSHDLRTPLNVIMGMNEIAIKNIDDKEKALECLGKVRVSGNHMLTLINDVLDISAIEMNRLVMNPTVVSVQEIKNEVSAIIKPAIAEKGITITLDSNMTEDIFVYADALRIKQIAMNILSNAIKFTKVEGHISVGLRFEEPKEKEETIHIVYWVEDDGVGMTQEFMKTMFDAFTREVDSRTSKIQGSGLGLAITKQIVDCMNGTIKVDSKVNEGSTFTVTLDLERAKKENYRKDAKNVSADDTSHKSKNKKILVAEDIEFNWEVVCDQLEELGIESQWVSNGQECLDLVEQSDADTFSLILMDIHMPIMDGLEATREIRQLSDHHKASIPIIAMTADAFDENVKSCLNAGMDGHLSKPLTIKKMKQELGKYIEL